LEASRLVESRCKRHETGASERPDTTHRGDEGLPFFFYPQEGELVIARIHHNNCGLTQEAGEDGRRETNTAGTDARARTNTMLGSASAGGLG